MFGPGQMPQKIKIETQDSIFKYIHRILMDVPSFSSYFPSVSNFPIWTSCTHTHTFVRRNSFIHCSPLSAENCIIISFCLIFRTATEREWAVCKNIANGISTFATRWMCIQIIPFFPRVWMCVCVSAFCIVSHNSARLLFITQCVWRRLRENTKHEFQK